MTSTIPIPWLTDSKDGIALVIRCKRCGIAIRVYPTTEGREEVVRGWIEQHAQCEEVKP